VEFSLVIMIFMTLVMAIAEFAFYLTIKVGIANTAQDAVQYAAQLGTTGDADFLVLQLVEKDVSTPMDRTKIKTVEIFQTDSYGSAVGGVDTYTRGGSYVDPNNTTLTVPYSQGGMGFAPATRCNIMGTGACGGIDYIGVKITYQYGWVTPAPNLVGLGGAPPKFIQSSSTRMEPIQ
jgi:Flp pilus assembly protein TadG